MAHTPETNRHSLWLRLARLGMRPQMLTLMLADAVALQASALLAFTARSLMGPLDPALHTSIMPLLLLGPIFSVALGASQSIALPPHKEVKQLFMATTLTYLVILAFLFLTKGTDAFSRLLIMGAWLCSVFAVPLLRGRLRRALCRRPWWSLPLVFLQSGPQTDELSESLTLHPERGLKPVAVLHAPPDAAENQAFTAQMSQTARQYPNAVALIFPDALGAASSAFIREATLHFKMLLLVPGITLGENRLWLTPRDLQGAVGLLVRQNLLDARRLRVKRCIDVVLTLLGSLLILPLALLLAICIRLDSPGPVIYAQTRLGQGGRHFRVYKFRTMVSHADRLLAQHLAENPRLREEWEKDHKLRNDPRITRMGTFLRKTSLDELPQLWNVITGSMSLVGPRPIVESEVNKYGRVYAEYRLVRPGITGLWQVSGRNNTTYADRVRLDLYYVTNWSVWMDLWILARTIPVVIRGNGAY